MLKYVEFPDNEENGILKGKKFDFCNSKGEPYKTIIFIGENGTGKTTFFNYFKNHIPSPEDIFALNYYPQLNEINVITTNLIPNLHKNECYCFFYSSNYDNNCKFICFKQIPQIFLFNENINENLKLKDYFIHVDTTRLYGRSAYYDSVVKNEIKRNFLSTYENISTCKKNIINVYFNSKMTNSNKFTIFKNFCDDFFKLTCSNLLIDEINANEVWFKKNNKKITIDDLSSGEQDILIRAISLLIFTNLDNLVFFIDEPENYLHPKWQKNILNFYQEILKNSNTQLFIATHSSHIVESAMQNLEKNLLFDFNKKEPINDKIKENKILNYSSIDEINYMVFEILSNSYFLQLYEYLKNKSKYDIKGKNEYDEFDEYLIKEYKLENLIIDFNEHKITKLSRLRHFIAHGNSEKDFVEYKNQKLNIKDEKIKNFFWFIA